MPELYEWQKPHVDALELALNKYNVAADLSDLGCGKTICACELGRRRGQDLIVVAKKVMLPTWKYWMDQFGLSGVVAGWELARRRGLPSRSNALYVFDEVHEASGYQTLNAKLVVNVFERKLPMLLLSATMMETPLKMWALGYLLGMHNLTDFYRWMFRNGVKKNYGYGGYHFTGSKSVLANINKQILPERGSRMRKAEIPDFPECQYIIELVEGEPDDKRLETWFKQIAIRVAEHQAKIDESEEPWNPAGDILPEILFDRMRAELSKVPALIELVKEGWESNYRVVVFVNFITTLAALENLLELGKNELIWGEQKPAERLETIRAFQANQSKIICSTIDSGGASIDLHDLEGGHPRLSLVCPTWRAVSFRQALGRIHRAGAKSKSVQKFVFLGEGIEERVATVVRSKLNAIDTINDRDLTADEFQTV